MPDQIHSYRELQQQIHEDLRIQHPDWVEPSGDCPTCDSYELRLAELLGAVRRSAVVEYANHPDWAMRGMTDEIGRCNEDETGNSNQ
jgi:hypothetical protein